MGIFLGSARPEGCCPGCWVFGGSGGWTPPWSLPVHCLVPQVQGCPPIMLILCPVASPGPATRVQSLPARE